MTNITDKTIDIAQWMYDNPEGFLVIWDVRYERTMKYTYRKIASKCSKAPLKATRTGQIRRIVDGVPHVSGAIVSPNIMYFMEPSSFLVYTDKKSAVKFQELFDYVRGKGIEVEVIEID